MPKLHWTNQKRFIKKLASSTVETIRETDWPKVIKEGAENIAQKTQEVLLLDSDCAEYQIRLQ